VVGPSIISQFKGKKKVNQMVTAINSCKDTQFKVDDQGDGFYIQYGGWTKKEAGVKNDLKVLSVSKKSTWQLPVAELKL